jgi:hypothetical protein
MDAYLIVHDLGSSTTATWHKKQAVREAGWAVHLTPMLCLTKL